MFSMGYYSSNFYSAFICSYVYGRFFLIEVQFFWPNRTTCIVSISELFILQNEVEAYILYFPLIDLIHLFFFWKKSLWLWLPFTNLWTHWCDIIIPYFDLCWTMISTASWQLPPLPNPYATDRFWSWHVWIIVHRCMGPFKFGRTTELSCLVAYYRNWDLFQIHPIFMTYLMIFQALLGWPKPIVTR